MISVAFSPRVLPPRPAEHSSELLIAMKYTLALVSAVLLAGEAAASAVNFDRSVRAVLQARQGSIIDPGDIAPECQTTCAPMVKAFNGCTTNECLCTNEVVQATASCLNCSLNVNGRPSAALINQAQEALDELEDGCKAAGEPVTSLTLSGAGSVTGSATHSATGTAVIPTGTETSQSIFFSSASAPGAPSATNPINTATTGLPIQPSHVTISVLPSDETSAGAGSNTAAGSPTPTGSSSGGVITLAGGFSSVAVAAVIGGAMLVLA